MLVAARILCWEQLKIYTDLTNYFSHPPDSDCGTLPAAHPVRHIKITLLDDFYQIPIKYPTTWFFMHYWHCEWYEMEFHQRTTPNREHSASACWLHRDHLL
jgi:hypothetical protein